MKKEPLNQPHDDDDLFNEQIIIDNPYKEVAINMLKKCNLIREKHCKSACRMRAKLPRNTKTPIKCLH